MNTNEEMILVELGNLRREMTTIRKLVSDAVNYLRDAESEVPEKMRRFANYMHDVHHIIWTYEERGHQAPEYIKRDLERCDDRYRQLLAELNMGGGAFDKVRREMATDPMNRWDHTRQLAAPTHQLKEKKDEAGPSEPQWDGGDEGRTEAKSSKPERGFVDRLKAG